MEIGISCDVYGFSPGARVKKDHIKISGPIYPFLPNITTLLKSHFIGTAYEQMFCGNFVDRTHVFDSNMLPKKLIWDPLSLESFPSRKNERNIYCLLADTISKLDILLNDQTYSSKVKYYLTLYMDMHIPIINYLECLLQKQEELLANVEEDRFHNYVIDEWKDLLTVNITSWKKKSS